MRFDPFPNSEATRQPLTSTGTRSDPDAAARG